jgi:hypothetical protein
MAQYWLQIPVENAKEVVQRYVDNYSSFLLDYNGKTISYNESCEVILTADDIMNYSANTNYIYFGTFIITATGGESSLILTLSDNSGNEVTIFNCASGTNVNAGHYPYIMWNRIVQAATDTSCYFVGYKFTIS